MFDPTSRYYKIETKSLTRIINGEPHEIRYVTRRFIPPNDTLMPVVEHTVTQGDRLDNITARYLGDPTQFWRVCDANTVLQPEELEQIGKKIAIAFPQL